jgi:histidinol-phosphate aminotransferase
MQRFTRRDFGRLASLLTAGATLPFYNEQALAQFSVIGRIPDSAVKINANENPLGPCKEAAEAIYHAARNGGRYYFEEIPAFAQTLAEVEGVSASSVLPFAGSSDALHRAVLAFTSPVRPLVTSDPTFEVAPATASYIGAKAIQLPLTKDYRHDVKAMAAADPNTGLFYICSPNNPTGTVSPKEDIEWLLGHKPAGSIVLLDEAYVHFSHSATPATYLVAQEKDIIVLRTFSKIYGMAGLRAGAAIARPDLLSKLRYFGMGPLPSTGMMGATASLKVKNLVPERRKYVREIREDVLAFLDQNRIGFVPSESNKFMMDVKRPGQEVARALAAENVYIGRVWPCWPTHVRVTVGTKEEMEKFKIALLKVINA